MQHDVQANYHVSAMDRYVQLLLGVVLFVSDYFAIITAGAVALGLRNALVRSSELSFTSLYFYWLFPLIFMAFVASSQLYRRRLPFWQIVEKLFYASVYGTASIIVLLYIVQISGTTSRLFVGLFFLFGFFFLVLYRYILKKLLDRFHFLQIPVLIIGAGKTAESLLQGINGDAGMGYRVIGLLEDNEATPCIVRRYPILGRFADAEQVIAETGVDSVYIAAPGMPQEELATLIYRVQSLVNDVGVVPNLVGIPMGGIDVESLFNEKLMVVRVRNNLGRKINRIIKFLFDMSLTIMGTICISPILLFIAVWIYKDSPGPVLFKHTRIGRNGKEFPCYKFRSMCIDAKERLEELLDTDPLARDEWEKDFKLQHDPRITKSGAFLRKTSLDELPQIFNVLRGEMSLVGPRPIIRDEMDRYGTYITDYLMVRPGITGMWQVSGRSDIDYSKRVKLDSWYVRNWSVWLDIMLLWRTFKAVKEETGAY